MTTYLWAASCVDELSRAPREAFDRFFPGAQLLPERTPFHSVQIPGIRLVDYAARICRYAQSSPECLPMAVLYMLRYSLKAKQRLTPYNVHRLLLCSMLVAAKTRDDIFYANDYYASLGGVSVREMSGLEGMFLEAVEFELFVDPEEYEALLKAMRDDTDGDEYQHAASSDAVVSAAAAAGDDDFPFIRHVMTFYERGTFRPPPKILVEEPATEGAAVRDIASPVTMSAVVSFDRLDSPLLASSACSKHSSFATTSSVTRVTTTTTTSAPPSSTHSSAFVVHHQAFSGQSSRQASVPSVNTCCDDTAATPMVVA